MGLSVMENQRVETVIVYLTGFSAHFMTREAFQISVSVFHSEKRRILFSSSATFVLAPTEERILRRPRPEQAKILSALNKVLAGKGHCSFPLQKNNPQQSSLPDHQYSFNYPSNAPFQSVSNIGTFLPAQFSCNAETSLPFSNPPSAITWNSRKQYN